MFYILRFLILELVIFSGLCFGEILGLEKRFGEVSKEFFFKKRILIVENKLWD